MITDHLVDGDSDTPGVAGRSRAHLLFESLCVQVARYDMPPDSPPLNVPEIAKSLGSWLVHGNDRHRDEFLAVLSRVPAERAHECVGFFCTLFAQLLWPEQRAQAIGELFDLCVECGFAHPLGTPDLHDASSPAHRSMRSPLRVAVDAGNVHAVSHLIERGALEGTDFRVVLNDFCAATASGLGLGLFPQLKEDSPPTSNADAFTRYVTFKLTPEQVPLVHAALMRRTVAEARAGAGASKSRGDTAGSHTLDSDSDCAATNTSRRRRSLRML